MLTRKNHWVNQENKQPEDYLTVEQFKKYFPKLIFNLNGTGKTLISVLSTLRGSVVNVAKVNVQNVAFLKYAIHSTIKRKH